MLEDFRLKVFMAVVKERSFTKAAAALDISQPAVSQNISELEKSVDMKLFDRLRTEVAITPQGRIFYDFAKKILASYEDMNQIFCNPSVKNCTEPVIIYVSPLLEAVLLEELREKSALLRPSLALQFTTDSEAAQVCILAKTERKDADLNIKINVISSDILLQAYFKQLVDYLVNFL